jgi:hypothetical protein
MKNHLVCAALILLAASTAFSQKRQKPQPVKAKPIVFAVLDDGKTIEPIGEINKGELAASVNGGDDAKKIASFTNAYYKPKTVYNLCESIVKS